MKSFTYKKISIIILFSIFITVFGIIITNSSILNQVDVDSLEKIKETVSPENIYHESDYAEQIFDRCAFDMHCTVELLSNISREKEKPFVMSTFKELLLTYKEKQANYRCHDMAHHLGMWVYGYTKNLEESFGYADPLTCGAGIYHGIFENYFSVLNFEGTKPDTIDITHLCSNTESNFYSLKNAHCVHGIGHGVLLLYNDEVSNAVKRCEDFRKDLEQNSCANGIFMGNILINFESNNGDFLKDDIQYPCNKMKTQFISPCYIWQGGYILKQRDYEVYSSFNECDKINQEFIKYCYYGIGLELETDAGGNMDLALSFCQAGNVSSYHKYCFRGMGMKTSMVYLDNGFGFCALVPDVSKEECYDGLGYWIKMRDADDKEREKKCSKIQDDHYFIVCMNPKRDGITFI